MTEIDWVKRLQEEGAELDEDGPEAEAPETSRPSNITQHTLLSYITSNYDVWVIVEPITKPEYFDEEYKKIVELILSHTAEYKQMPANHIIRMKTGVMLDTYADALDPRTVDWLLNEYQTFCRHRATEIELRRAASATEKGSTREIIEQIFQNFKMITEINLEKDLGVEVHKDARRMLNEPNNEEIKPTGYRHLDLCINKGLPSPGVAMFAGMSGLGKSVTLANFGVNYCQQGNFVVYISLELPHKRIFERVCAMMTEIPIRSIYLSKDKAADDMEARFETRTDGLFYVKKMSMSGTTTAHLSAYLKELYIKVGRKPDVIILDYLDLLTPRANIRDLSNIHIKDKYAAEEFYALCEEWQALGLTASQMVKNSADMDEWDHGSVGGGTPKVNTVDYLFVLKRNGEEFWMRCLKGRYGGENTYIPFIWDLDTLRIRDGLDEHFYQKNPRYDPNFKRTEAQNTQKSNLRQLNKDVRAVRNDSIMDAVRGLNKSILENDFERYTEDDQ